jgi:hypothetical protein
MPEPARLPPDPSQALDSLRGLVGKPDLKYSQAVYGVPVAGMVGRVDLTTGTLSFSTPERHPSRGEMEENLRAFFGDVKKTEEQTARRKALLTAAREERAPLDEEMMRLFGPDSALTAEEVAEMRRAAWEFQPSEQARPGWLDNYAEADPEGGKHYIPEEKFNEMLATVHPDHIAGADGTYFGLNKNQRKRLNDEWQERWSKDDPEGKYKKTTHKQRMSLIGDNPFLTFGQMEKPGSRPIMPKNWRGIEGNRWGN